MTKICTYVEIDVPEFIAPVSLLHFDEPGNSPPIVSDKNTGGVYNTWTFSGDATVTSGSPNPKFGTGFLLLDGTGDLITTPDETEFSLGSSDFTIDLWFNCNAAGGTEKVLAGQANAAGLGNSDTAWLLRRDTSNHIVGSVVQGTTTTSVTGTTAFTNATNIGWNHVAFVRTGNTLKLFLNGVQEGGDVSFSGAVNNSASALGVGSGGGYTTNPWNGGIDEFRLLPGLAYWTAAFTPPTAAYDGLTTYRFAIDAAYLLPDVDAIPSIKTVNITPAIVSLGGDLGQRASVEVVFKDHRHIFASESYDSGTFWGKFRARHGLKLTGYDLRVLRGPSHDPIDNFETRHFIIDSVDGPLGNGEYKIVAKDALKTADGDRAQAPVMSNGFTPTITSLATTFTLSPTGIGNSEYPTSGYLNLGGKEIVSFTRIGDNITMTRAQFNTTAVAHDANERAQLCLQYSAQDVAVIINDLLVNYAGVDPTWIPLTTWQTESDTYLSTSYSALIAEPTSVAKLISELIEQAGLAIWWDDIAQQVNFQVLHAIPSNAETYNGDKFLADSFEVKEQPEKRLSQVYTYFAKLNPLVNEDQVNNYRSTAFATDQDAEFEYAGVPAIKKIYSRWIPDGGRSIADNLNTVLLARFRDPPRAFRFDILRDSGVNPHIGIGYQIEHWSLQDTTGAAVSVPAQITRLNPRVDVFEVEAEEMQSSTLGATSPDVHAVIIDANQFNVNLRTMHDTVFGTPASGTTVRCTISSGIIVGSTTTATPAFDVGTWPGGVTVELIVLGRIQGAGGNGGIGRSSGYFAGTGTPGSAGGVALYTRQAITLTDSSGAIWGGGGGGGGCTAPGFQFNGCGGGGAGTNAGAHGGGDASTAHGTDGTATAGGTGGISVSGNNGGNGGGPGIAGSAGAGGLSGGAAGSSIDGVSHVTTSGGAGDRRGGQIN